MILVSIEMYLFQSVNFFILVAKMHIVRDKCFL